VSHPPNKEKPRRKTLQVNLRGNTNMQRDDTAASSKREEISFEDLSEMTLALFEEWHDAEREAREPQVSEALRRFLLNNPMSQSRARLVCAIALYQSAFVSAESKAQLLEADTDFRQGLNENVEPRN
jgi:hypothetical protein